ncbi:MAG: 30S ribosomal protein S20 [Bacteroidales bacterium]|nr:30S ribosomal protein S20 [Bacteroidales bacterium]
MANHKSALKRIKQNEKRRLRNRYWGKTMRNALKKARNIQEASELQSKMPEVVSLIDKAAKKGVIHKNKAANLKSGLMTKLNKMA